MPHDDGFIDTDSAGHYNDRFGAKEITTPVPSVAVVQCLMSILRFSSLTMQQART